MKRNNRSRLENIISESSRVTHKVSDHPHEFIASHVIMITMISIMFLGAILFYVLATPMNSLDTAYVIIDFNEIDINFNLSEKVGSLFDVLLDPAHRNEFMLISYICWILILGALNLYSVEKEFEKK